MATDLYNGERLMDVPSIDSQIENEHRHRYKMASEYIVGKYVLDAACGSGYGTKILAEAAKTVIGIDYDADLVEYCKNNNEKKNVIFRQMSVVKLDFPDNYFDAVVSFETIEHISPEQQPIFIKEIKRVLKPEGLLFISSPDQAVWERWQNGDPNEFHIGELDRDNFEKLLKKYFCQFYLYAQDYVPASIITSSDDTNSSKLIYSQNYDFNTQPLYNIAICSDGNIPSISSSVYLQNRISAYIEKQLGFSEMYLYFDQGDGFCEADKIKAPLKCSSGDLLSVTFSLPAEAKALRFDPGEKPCCISEIHLSDDCLSVNAVNGVCQADGSFLFICPDPMFLIEGASSYPRYTEITIRLKYSFLEQGILSYIETLKKQEYQLAKKNQRMVWKRRRKWK